MAKLQVKKDWTRGVPLSLSQQANLEVAMNMAIFYSAAESLLEMANTDTKSGAAYRAAVETFLELKALRARAESDLEKIDLMLEVARSRLMGEL